MMRELEVDFQQKLLGQFHRIAKTHLAGWVEVPQFNFDSQAIANALASRSRTLFMNMQPTPYDLNFRVLGIPVRVHPSFWLVIAIFSWPLARDGFQFWLIGMACMSLSLLAHELAHALTFRYFGVRSVIFCYSFGGLTAPEGRLRDGNQRILVTLAGPFTNFLIAALTYGSDIMEPWQFTNDYTEVIYWVLFRINLFLGLLNLLPVYPLDGGQVSREIWVRGNPGNGVVNSLWMSLIVAATFSIYALACEYNLIPKDVLPWWMRAGLFAGILFAILAAQNYAELQNTQRTRRFNDHSHWR